MRPAKTQISLGIYKVWSESLLSAWRKLGSLATHWAHSEDSDQTGRMHGYFVGFVTRWLICLQFSINRLVEEKYGNKPRQDKNSKISMRPAKTQISLGAQPLCWFCHVAAHMISMFGMELKRYPTNCEVWSKHQTTLVISWYLDSREGILCR